MAQLIEILPCGWQGLLYIINTMAADDLEKGAIVFVERKKD